MSEPSAYYICKNTIQGELEAWVRARDESRERGQPEPPVPESIGKAIIQICDGMAKRSNFNRYTFLDEMKGDAIVDCLKAVRCYKIDHVKKNPFGYFSRVAWNSFVQRISIEAAQQKTKLELFLDENYEAYHTIDGDERGIDKNGLRQHFSIGDD